MTNDGEIDYSGYSRSDLQQALSVINRQRYPKNFENLSRELAARPAPPPQHAATSEITPASPYAIYAGFWRRLFASVVDGLVICPLTLFFNWGVNHYRLFYVCFLLPLLCFHLFYWAYLVQRYGGTPGKRLTGLGIYKADKTQIGYQAAIIRYLPYLLLAALIGLGISAAELSTTDSYFYSQPEDERTKLLTMLSPIWYKLSFAVTFIWLLCEFITMLLNRRRRTLHDYMAGTVVLIESRLDAQREDQSKPAILSVE